MSDHGDTVSLRSGEGEILHTEPPKRPLLAFVRSLIRMSTKGDILPDKIHLNRKLYDQFLLEFCEKSEFLPPSDRRAVIPMLGGVPVYQHGGSAPIILFLPDYGFSE